MIQPEYKILKAALEKGLPKEAIYAIFEKQDAIQKKGIHPETLFNEMADQFPGGTKIKANFYEDSSDVPDPRELSRNDKNLMIFDDVMLEKQNRSLQYAWKTS